MRKYVCIKDMRMSGDGVLEFNKGAIYERDGQSFISNNSGGGHGIGSDDWLNKYFIEIKPKIDLNAVTHTIDGKVYSEHTIKEALKFHANWGG